MNVYLRRCVRAFSVSFLFGISSLFLDADHIPPLIAKGLPINITNLATQSSRALHPLYWDIGWNLIGFSAACMAGLWLFLLAKILSSGQKK